MSSSTPERRTDPSPTTRTTAGGTTGTTGTTGSTDPGATSRFRPFGSSTPTTATPVNRDPATGNLSAAEWEDPEDTGPERVRHIVDRFDGAAGLLVLRLVTAVILGIRGLQILQHLDVTRDQFTQIGMPSPDTMAIVVGAAAFAAAFALVVGAFVRVAGLGIAAIAIGSLVYVKWRNGDVFTAGQPGFNGELELLLAGVGLAFLGLGGGGWGVDRRFRRR